VLCLVELRVSRTAADGFLHFLCRLMDGETDIIIRKSAKFIFKYFTFFVRAFIGAFLFFESGGEYLSLCLKSCYP